MKVITHTSLVMLVDGVTIKKTLAIRRNSNSILLIQTATRPEELIWDAEYHRS